MTPQVRLTQLIDSLKIVLIAQPQSAPVESAAQLDAGTVALVHNGSLFIGSVGEMQTL